MKPTLLDERQTAAIDAYLATASVVALETADPLGAYLVSEEGESFHQELFEYIRLSGKTDQDIYTAVGLNRRRFSEIRSDRNFKPDKRMVLSFVFVLHLDLGQAEHLLQTAGWALSRSSTFDLIVRYYLERGDVNVFHVNDALYTYHQPLLCGVVAGD